MMLKNHAKVSCRSESAVRKAEAPKVDCLLFLGSERAHLVERRQTLHGGRKVSSRPDQKVLEAKQALLNAIANRIETPLKL